MSMRIARVIGILLLAAAPVSAQGLPGGRRPDAIDSARGPAIQPFHPRVGPDRPGERWVSPRGVYSPELGRDVQGPGHYERDANGQRVERPPLIVTTPEGGRPTILPGGERPPVEQRNGP